MKIIIAGSSGFIGSALVAYFEGQGHSVIQLSRHPQSPSSYYWNPEEGQLDPAVLEGAQVVINLSGESILGRWTEKKMEQIKQSRLIATRFLCDHLLKLPHLPQVFINASAIGYYGDRPNEIVDESSPSGQTYLAEVCRLWEQISEQLAARGVRVVLARFGIVLGQGGALKQMDKAFRMGMGGVLGTGEQMMSWISIDDLCGAMHHIITHDQLSGPVNFVSPEPLSNLAFTQTLGTLLHRPTIVPIPTFALNLLFGPGAEIFLASAHVRPSRLLESGYKFQVPDIQQALKKYLLINS